jgi:kynureninase
MFVSSRLQERVRSPITGWLGHARPFDFGQEYAPAGGIDRFLCGTHPVIGLVALESGVDCLLAAPREWLWEKSQRLCELFIRLIDSRCRQFGVEVISPRDASERGSHVGVRFAEALPVIEKLISQGVIGDYRAPDIMRFGFTPLYVGYEDVWRAVDALHDVLGSRTWDRPEFRIRKASG